MTRHAPATSDNPGPDGAPTWRLSSTARVASLIAAGLLVAACASAPPADPTTTEGGTRSSGSKQLTGAEARATLGKPQRYRWTTAAGATGYTQVSANGRIRTYWDSDAVNGNIRFIDEGYCTRYDGVRDNREDCYRIYRITPTQYRIFRADGIYSGLIELER